MQIYWLTKESVSIMERKSPSNTDIWKVYGNSLQGRDELSTECPPKIVAEVMAVWGDTPTMPDVPSIPDVPHPAPPSDPRDLAITQLMREVAALKAKEAEHIG